MNTNPRRALRDVAKAENESLLRLATTHREEMFTVAPVLAYLVGRIKEVEQVRMIMISKLNGMDAAHVAELLPTA